MKFPVSFGYKLFLLTPEQKTQWDKTTGLGIVEQTKQRIQLIISWDLVDKGVHDIETVKRLKGE